MRVRVKGDDAGAVTEVVSLHMHRVTGWGQPLLDALAAAVGLPCVGGVWVLYNDGEVEGPLPGGRGSWRIVNEPDVTVLVTAGAATRFPNPICPICQSTARGAASGAPPPPVTPAQMASSPPVSPPITAVGRIGIELPTLTEEERNWRRIHALFLDEPCSVPRVLQQVSRERCMYPHTRTL